MKFYKKMFYDIKRLIPMAGLATLTMLPASCGPDNEPMKIEQNDSEKKHKNTPNDSVVPTDTVAPVDTITQPVDTRHDVEIPFVLQTAEYSLNHDIIQMHINDSTVRGIYLTPIGTWQTRALTGIRNFRKNRLEPIINKSPKIRGRGNFDFMPGEASKSESDSIWYIENGWTINNPHNILPMRDVEIIFTPDIRTTIEPSTIIACINDSTVQNIYLTSRGHWNHYTAEDIESLRQANLQYNVESSPKVHGRGDFDFKRGIVFFNDSVWLVNNGWTINKDLQR